MVCAAANPVILRELRFIIPPVITTLACVRWMSSAAQLILFVMIKHGMSGMMEHICVVVLPESIKIVMFGRMSLTAFCAISFFSSTLRTERVPRTSSFARSVSTDLAPPWMRTIRFFSSSTRRSVRIVMSDTWGKASFISANVTFFLSFTSAHIASLRFSIVSIAVSLSADFLLLGTVLGSS